MRSNIIILAWAIVMVVLLNPKEEPAQKHSDEYQPNVGSKEKIYYDHKLDNAGGAYIPDYPDYDIQIARENNPSVIIKPNNGRIVKSRKQEFEDRMEDYIDEHHEEIIENYSN